MDVYTRNLFPWMAARRERSTFFRTNEIFLANGGNEPQFFLERDVTNGLLVTVLVSDNSPPLVPLVRIATGDKVTKVVRSRFELVK